MVAEKVTEHGGAKGAQNPDHNNWRVGQAVGRLMMLWPEHCQPMRGFELPGVLARS